MIRSVLLIRHGESEVNVRQPPVIGGRVSGCALTPRGVAQARALGRWLAERGEPCDRVVSSTAVRAEQTARLCLEHAGVASRGLELFPDLEELSQGEWEGQLRSGILTPEVLARIEAERWDFRAPGGESLTEMQRRVVGWVEREVLDGAAEHLWVFCHGGVVKVLLAGLLGLDRQEAWKIPIHNTSLTRLAQREEGWVLLGRNETPHLRR